MAGTETQGTVTSLGRQRARPEVPERPDGMYTIAEVGDACGLPGPVIMQVVPRTWTPAGWMYTAEQLRTAVVIAEDLRRERGTGQGSDDL